MAFAIKEAFDALGGVQRNAAIVRWVNEHHQNRWDEKTIGSHLRGCSVNNPIGIKYHSHFPRFLYKRANGEFELYEEERHGLFDARGYREGHALEESDAFNELREISEEIQSKSEFANESQLRDYLAKNLGSLESGLVLWTGSEAESVEYSLEGRRIDILAKDRNGIPVVVELKLSKGHERTLGQALYYRGKLKQLLKLTRIRIIMVAAEITDELRIASAEIADVDVFSYRLTMQVEKVDLSSSESSEASTEIV